MSTTPATDRPVAQGPPAKQTSSLPTTKLGRISMWLAVAFIVMFGVNSVVFMPLSSVTNQTVTTFRQTVLPFYGIGMLACGVAAGVVGLISIIAKRERSLVVWLTLVPMAFVIFLLVGEFLFPH